MPQNCGDRYRKRSHWAEALLGQMVPGEGIEPLRGKPRGIVIPVGGICPPENLLLRTVPPQVAVRRGGYWSDFRSSMLVPSGVLIR